MKRLILAEMLDDGTMTQSVWPVEGDILATLIEELGEPSISALISQKDLDGTVNALNTSLVMFRDES